MNIYKVTLKSSTVHPDSRMRADALFSSEDRLTYFLAAHSYSEAEQVSPNKTHEIHSIECLGLLIGCGCQPDLDSRS